MGQIWRSASLVSALVLVACVSTPFKGQAASTLTDDQFLLEQPVGAVVVHLDQAGSGTGKTSGTKRK